MKSYAMEKLRNFILVGHGGCGKTMLAEAILYNAKATDRFGQVDDGTSVMDHDPEEVKRKISINTAVAPCEFKDHKFNILDTPGFFDFVGEVKSASRVVEAGILVVCASSGVEVGTEKSWDFLNERSLPRLIFINKMARESANFGKVVDALREKFGNRVIPVQLPIGEAENFKGIVDIINKKAWQDGKEVPIPAELSGEVDNYYQMLTEAVAESDEELLDKYLENDALSPEELLTGFRQETMIGEIVPVLCGSALKNLGITELMEAIIEPLPSPDAAGTVKAEVPGKGETVELIASRAEALSALVFKTMDAPFVGKLTRFRVYSGVVKSDSHFFNSSRNQEERIGQLFLIKGKNQIPVSEVGAGDIGAVAKLQVTATGDTLCTKDRPVVLPGIDFPKPRLVMAVYPKGKSDEEKISSGLYRLVEEDPTITVEKDTTTKELILAGLGDLHLEVITSKLQKKFGVEVDLKTPKVPYRETIRGTTKVEGKHKKQSGGRGQYGHV